MKEQSPGRGGRWPVHPVAHDRTAEPGQVDPDLVLAARPKFDLDAWDENWCYAPQLYCQRGAFVLRPNYHGSTNYGLAWVESITGGAYAGPELDDVEKGVDSLVARGLVDPGLRDCDPAQLTGRLGVAQRGLAVGQRLVEVADDP